MNASRIIELHPEAMEEARKAKEWYAGRSRFLGTAFMTELDTAIQRIAEAPDPWAIYQGDTRRYLLRRFPFGVIYRQIDNRIPVLAVAHTHRKPGYWNYRVL